MQTATFAAFADTPRKKFFWGLLGAVALVQLVAFYMLCSQQVHKAQLREAMMSGMQSAAADCIDYMPRTSMGSCRITSGVTRDGTPGYPRSNAVAAMPTGFSVR